MDASIAAKGGINGELNVSESSARLRGKTYLPSSITGTYDYEELNNHPLIEGHELLGDSKLRQIGVNTATIPEIEAILYLN